MKDFLLIPFICIPFYANAQTIDKIDPQSYSFTATRAEAITVDGRLDEAVWSQCEIIERFTNFEPTPGVPLSIPVKVRVCYNSDGIMVGMEAQDAPSEILKELSGRDKVFNSDQFTVIIDTYKSGLSGYQFSITPANVQLDMVTIKDEEDATWDAVWKSKVELQDWGWSAEIEIPYSALRFTKAEVQNWNINFSYNKKKTRESSTWRPRDITQETPLTQMGTMIINERLNPPFRLALYPYLALYRAESEKKKMKVVGGLDMKLGITDALTLDMTLIPDFGQVDYDERVVNLSAFEVEYKEKRPFFTEGLDLFRKSSLFYSRRIGGDLQLSNGPAELQQKEYADEYEKNSLINAFKLSGRDKNGFAIGILNAIEKRKFGKVYDTVADTFERLQVNPLTNYNIIVLDQNLRNNSSITLTNANVLRQGVWRDANNTELDLYLRDKSQKFYLRSASTLTQSFFSDEVSRGYRYGIEVGKNAGDFQYNMAYEEIGKKYNPSDLGIFSFYNISNLSPNLRLISTKKIGKVIKRTNELELIYSRYLQPNEFRKLIAEYNTFILFRNFFAIIGTVVYSPVASNDYFESRVTDFSHKFFIPAYTIVRPGISSDYRKRLAADVTYSHKFITSEGRSENLFKFSPRIRFSDHISLFGELQYEERNLDVGFFGNNSTLKLPDANPQAVIYSKRDLQFYTIGLNPQIKLTNNLNVIANMRTYWSDVHFLSLHEINTAGELSGTLKAPDDFNAFTSFNFIDFLIRLTWRYAPGSDLSLGWSNSRTAGYQLQLGYRDVFTGLFNNFGRENVFSLKINYYIDVNRLRKK